MLNSTSIKTKLILIVSLGILLSSILIALLSIYTIQSASDERIQEYKVQAYKEIQNNLENFSSIALSVIKHHHQLSNQKQMLNTLKEDLDTQMDSTLHQYFHNRVMKRGAFNTKAMRTNSSEALLLDKHGISFGTLNDKKYRIKALALSQKEHFPIYYPSLENIKNHRYPLTRFFISIWISLQKRRSSFVCMSFINTSYLMRDKKWYQILDRLPLIHLRLDMNYQK